MADADDRTTATVHFTASDGAALTGDLVVPAAPRMAAIVCHPHPLYGGDRLNTMVVGAADALTDRGIATLRFDFRRDFDGGRGERLDAIAAVDRLTIAAPGVPVVAVGYSFGALVAASMDDDRVEAQVLIAPPLGPPSIGAAASVPAPAIATLVLVPAHDQFAPPDVATPIVEGWRAASSARIDMEVIESADHSIGGRIRWAAERAADWLVDAADKRTFGV